MSANPNNFSPRDTNITIRQTADNDLQKSYYCSNCKNNGTTTRVINKPSSSGYLWAICCIFFGCWPLILFVCYTDGFRKQERHCLYCNALLETYETQFSGGMKFFIGITVVAVLGVWAIIIFVGVKYDLFEFS